MEHFLFWIGLYNFLGSFALMLMNRDKIADFVLRRATETIVQPYSHGEYGRIWLWWAASANLFLGAIMLLATRWPSEIKREVIVAVLSVYLIMYVVVLIGAKRPRYGRGVLALHFLWPAQILWGLWSLF